MNTYEVHFVRYSREYLSTTLEAVNDEEAKSLAEALMRANGFHEVMGIEMVGRDMEGEGVQQKMLSDNFNILGKGQMQ